MNKFPSQPVALIPIPMLYYNSIQMQGERKDFMEDNDKIEKEVLSTENEVKPADSAEPSTLQNESSSVQAQSKVPVKKRKGPIAKIKNFVSDHPVGTATAVAAILTLAKALCDMYELGKDTPCENGVSFPAQTSSDSAALSDSVQKTAVPVESPNETSEQNSREPITFPRKGCVVNMPESRRPSAAKRAEADEKGISLGEHQTIRRDHECTR